MRFDFVDWVVIGSHDGSGVKMMSCLVGHGCEDQASGFRGTDQRV